MYFSGFSRSKCMYFSTLWIERNTMTSFELCSGLLTLFFLFNFPYAKCKSEIVLSQTRVWGIWKDIYEVNGQGSNGHCRSWCIRQERRDYHLLQELTSLFLENQKVFTLGKQAEILNLETISSMNRWYRAIAWAGIANYNFVHRAPNKILESCFQPLEVSFLCLSTK